MWSETGDGLRRTFKTGNFAKGLEFVNQIGALAEAANHHPDVVLKYGSVEVLLISHDVGAVTDRDHRLAAQISEVALGLGLGSPVE